MIVSRERTPLNETDGSPHELRVANLPSFKKTQTTEFPHVGIDGMGTDTTTGEHENAHRLIVYNGPCEQKVDLHPAFLLTFPNMLLTSSIELMPCLFLKSFALDLIYRERECRGPSYSLFLRDILPSLVETQSLNLVKLCIAPDRDDQDQQCNDSSKWWIKGSKNESSLFKKTFQSPRDYVRCFIYVLSTGQSKKTMTVQDLMGIFAASMLYWLSTSNPHTPKASH